MPSNLSEPEIYLKCKGMLKEKNWTILGGEPPDGTDNIPRIELREPDNTERGSKGSKKIDLLATKSNKILLIELKENYSQSDVEKLNEIVSERRWRKALYTALKSKKAFEKAGIKEIPDFVNDSNLLLKSIGLSEFHQFPEDFILFVFTAGQYTINLGKSIVGFEI